jgi:hypothetical protein
VSWVSAYQVFHFIPASQQEYVCEDVKYDLPDYCINCGRPFMDHMNWHCPEAEDEE